MDRQEVTKRSKVRPKTTQTLKPKLFQLTQTTKVAHEDPHTMSLKNKMVSLKLRSPLSRLAKLPEQFPSLEFLCL